MVDLSNITQIRLLKQDYKQFPNKKHYNLKYVDKGNIDKYTNDLKRVVNLITEELTDWDQAPNYETVLRRFKADSHCLLFYYNNECIGWNWGNSNVCLDWETKIQDLLPGELYGGGCYVARNVNRPADAGLYNYNMIFKYWFNEMTYSTIYGYVDNWNKAALRVNYKNGLKDYNFLK